MSRPKSQKAKTITLYHRTGVNLLGLGYCGPEQAADIPADQARAWLHDNPKDWSRQPFLADQPSGDQLSGDQLSGDQPSSKEELSQ